MQTDKSVYILGEKVRLRTFLLTENLLPYQQRSDELFSYSIKDEFEKVIYKRKGTKKFQGVFEDSFEVLESMLGKIKIEFLNGKNVLKTEELEVAENVPNYFTVEIETNFATDFSESILKLKVFAKYIFGHFVKGKVEINTTLHEENNKENQWQGASQTLEINDEETVEFNLVDDLKVTTDKKSTIVVNFQLKFTEKFTGKEKRMDHSTLICVHDCHKVEIVPLDTKVKPGLSYSFYVNVYKLETMKLTNDESTSLEIKVQFYSKCSREIIGEISINKLLQNGSTDVTIEIPQKTNQILITSMFKNSTKSLELKTEPSKSGDSIKIETTSKK